MPASDLKPKTQKEIIELVIEKLKTIYDPEIPVNIFDLGLIYNIELEVVKNYTYCTVTMTLTSPGCSVADSIISDVHFYTLCVSEIDEVDISLVFDPPWDISHISKEGKEILELEGTVFPSY